MQSHFIERALKEVIRDYHAENKDSVQIIADNIARWYYITNLSWEDAISLMVEYCTKVTLSLTGKF